MSPERTTDKFSRYSFGARSFGLLGERNAHKMIYCKIKINKEMFKKYHNTSVKNTYMYFANITVKINAIYMVSAVNGVATLPKTCIKFFA